jgi:hypothetical protein
MPIMDYREYMTPELGKGKIASYHEGHADTGAAGADIQWGLAVQLSASNPNQVIPYDGTGNFQGVAMANHYAETRLSDVSQFIDGHYVANDAVSYMRRGIIFVEVEEDVIKGDNAVIDKTTANFRPATTTVTTVSGVIGSFKSSAPAGNLAELEINLP